MVCYLKINSEMSIRKFLRDLCEVEFFGRCFVNKVLGLFYGGGPISTHWLSNSRPQDWCQPIDSLPNC